jgi:glucosamine--fructose-6-phosphate aminotransferase (isomerizing)
MCGIFAYIWWNNTKAKLINWLKNLEYRGYDSAWICMIDKNKDIFLKKAVWKVSNLASKLEDIQDKYFLGIAHTRWATHGGVNEKNCHPHHSENKRFYIVHNGIIENFIQLKEELENKWYKFYSDTDSEVVAKLIEDNFEKDLLTTIRKIIPKLQWAYAFAIIDKENPNEVIWVKLGSPLVLWIGENEYFLSSDPNALRWECKKFIPLQDKELVIINDNGYKILSFEFEEKTKEWLEFENYDTNSSKWEFKHFMLKEIFEIPQIFENAIAGRVNFKTKEITSNTLEKLAKENIQKIEIIASWTSYNAGYTASYWFEELANIPTSVYVSTEYKYKKHFIDDKTLYIFISQSWETADTLECLKIVKAKWWKTFGIVNVVASSIAQLTDMGLYTHSWVEVGVASTKAFIWQLSVLLLMALKLWLKNNLDYTRYEQILNGLSSLWEKLNEVLLDSLKIKKISEKYSKYNNMFFLWRNLLYPIAMEWSLKLKEITYHHSESYSAGELKHGPLSLIDKNFPSVLINPKTSLYEKNISTLKEIQARNGKVIGLITKWDENSSIYNDIIEVPYIDEILTPFVSATALDLFAYYMADFLWREIDKPRNLAKSVTVE